MAESNKATSGSSTRAKQASTASTSTGDGDACAKASPAPSDTKRPATATGNRRSASAENVSNNNLGKTREKSSSSLSLAERQEKVRVLREKQIEERKKKNEDRRSAFEERKRKMMEEEKARWEDLKARAATANQQNTTSQGTGNLRPGTGRKLPNVPLNTHKRPNSASPNNNTSTRPSTLPKQKRPVSATAKRSPGANTLQSSLQSSPSSSTSPNVSVESSPHQSPASTPTSSRSKSSLAKSSSTSYLPGANRRGSAGSLHLPSSSSKSRPRSVHGLNPPKQVMGKRSSSHDSLSATSNRPLSKAHSTSALNQLHAGERAGRRSFSGAKTAHKDESHGHKPTAHSQKHKNKSEPKPHAGLTDEKAAKEALAERRRKAREEAERQAALDKEKAEQERIRKEEEERIRLEEEKKEEARQRELAELLQQQEKERLQRAIEDAERKAKEEAEQLVAEQKRKEEEKKQKEEEEKKARELVEQKLREDEERRKVEEIERNERRKRVEMIMSRTRQTATTTQPIQKDSKELDPESTKRKVDEILQKAKDRSSNQFQLPKSTAVAGGTSAPTCDQNISEKQETVAQQIENVLSSINQTFGSSEENITKLSVNGESETEEVSIGDELGQDNVDHSKESRTFDDNIRIPSIQVDEPVEDVQTHNDNRSENDRQKNTVLDEYNEKMNENSLPENETHITNGDRINGEASENKMLNQHNSEGHGSVMVKLDRERVTQGMDDMEIWSHTESVMRTKQAEVLEVLENAGIVAEGDEKFYNSDEDQLWEIVEGKANVLANAV